MKASVITNFSRMRDSELSSRAYIVVEKMTDNPHFPAPLPSLADVIVAREGYDHACEQAQHGGKDKTAVKKARRIALEKVLHDLAMYVQLHCKNDRAIVMSSGFDLRKPWTRSPRVLLPPAKFRLLNGPHPGSMKAIVSKVTGAGGYAFEYAPMPVTAETRWEKISVNSRTHTFVGLTRGQEYAFRVSGIGYLDKPVYTEVISQYTQ